MRKKQRKSKYASEKPAFNSRKLIIVIVGIVGIFTIAISGVVIRYWLLTLSDTSEPLVVPVAAKTQSRTLEEVLAEYTIQVQDITYQESGDIVVFHLVDGPRVTFSGTKNFEEQVKLLESIQARLRIENKNPTDIELHYSKPIVKF